MNTTLLEIKGLSVQYEGAIALDNICLSVDTGKIVTILGANGAGKSTMLRTISGLKQALKGEIHFLKKRIDRLAPHKIVGLGISHCPEGRRLFSEMKVIENLKMGTYPNRTNLEKKDLFKKVFELFPIIKERQAQIAGTMSGGEQQMLAIARAVLNSPKLLLLDEPSIGLSPIMVKEIGRAIREIKNLGVSILLVEQNANFALSEADYVYVMETGKIIIEGNSVEVGENPEVQKAYLGI